MAQKSVLQYSHLPACLILVEDFRRTSEPEVQRNFSPALWADSGLWKQWWWGATGVWKLEISKLQFAFCRHVKYFCPASRNVVGTHADSFLSYPTWLHTFCWGNTHTDNPRPELRPRGNQTKKARMTWPRRLHFRPCEHTFTACEQIHNNFRLDCCSLLIEMPNVMRCQCQVLTTFPFFLSLSNIMCRRPDQSLPQTLLA